MTSSSYRAEIAGASRDIWTTRHLRDPGRVESLAMFARAIRWPALSEGLTSLRIHLFLDAAEDEVPLWLGDV